MESGRLYYVFSFVRGSQRISCSIIAEVGKRIENISVFHITYTPLFPVSLGKDDSQRTSYKLSTSFLSFDTYNVDYVHSRDQSVSYLT